MSDSRTILCPSPTYFARCPLVLVAKRCARKRGVLEVSKEVSSLLRAQGTTLGSKSHAS